MTTPEEIYEVDLRFRDQHELRPIREAIKHQTAVLDRLSMRVTGAGARGVAGGGAQQAAPFSAGDGLSLASLLSTVNVVTSRGRSLVGRRRMTGTPRLAPDGGRRLAWGRYRGPHRPGAPTRPGGVAGGEVDQFAHPAEVQHVDSGMRNIAGQILSHSSQQQARQAAIRGAHQAVRTTPMSRNPNAAHQLRGVMSSLVERQGAGVSRIFEAAHQAQQGYPVPGIRSVALPSTRGRAGLDEPSIGVVAGSEPSIGEVAGFSTDETAAFRESAARFHEEATRRAANTIQVEQTIHLQDLGGP